MGKDIESYRRQRKGGPRLSNGNEAGSPTALASRPLRSTLIYIEYFLVPTFAFLLFLFLSRETHIHLDTHLLTHPPTHQHKSTFVKSSKSSLEKDIPKEQTERHSFQTHQDAHHTLPPPRRRRGRPCPRQPRLAAHNRDLGLRVDHRMDVTAPTNQHSLQRKRKVDFLQRDHDHVLQHLVPGRLS